MGGRGSKLNNPWNRGGGEGRIFCKSRKENPQKLTQLSSRSHPRHLMGKRTAHKDIRGLEFFH